MTKLDETREILRSIGSLYRATICTERDLLEIRSQIGCLRGMSFDRVRRPGAVPKSPVEETVERLLAHEERYAKALEAYYARREYVERCIAAMPHEISREVLTLRYVQGLTVGEMARVLHYTPRWVKALLQTAIKEFTLIHFSARL